MRTYVPRNVSNHPITIAHLHNSAGRGHNADSDWHVSGVGGDDGSIISRRHYNITRFASISFRVIIINIQRRRVRSCLPIGTSPPGRSGYRSCVRRNGRNYIIQPVRPRDDNNNTCGADEKRNNIIIMYV